MKTIRILFLVAFLGFPAFAAANSHLSDDPAVTEARTLIAIGAYDRALGILWSLDLTRPDGTDLLFLIGLAAIGSAEQLEEDSSRREALLDEAIAAMRSILVNQPELIRVRLELARAFFLKGEDGLAREHFERVLAGRLPRAVAINVNRFLSEIRARRRWSGRFGFSVAPDSNLSGASESETIYIFGLPFRRDTEEGARSGVGVIVWGGGEYQYPLQEQLRLRAGADILRKDYEGNEFDSTSVTAHLGPRWLIDSATEASLLATAERNWSSGSSRSRASGARLEFRHRLTERLSTNGRVSWKDRSHYSGTGQDGPQSSLSLGGSWRVSPTTRLTGNVGYDKERPKSEIWRNHTRSVRADVSVDLPRGFTFGGGGGFRWTDYRGSWGFFTPGGTTRSDRTRILRVSLQNRVVDAFGFSPRLTLVNEARESNAQLYDYRRNRMELAFQRLF